MKAVSTGAKNHFKLFTLNTTHLIFRFAKYPEKNNRREQ